MKPWPDLFFIFLLLILVAVGLVSAESWSKEVEGIKIIKINKHDLNWKSDLQSYLRGGRVSENVLVEVHGVEIVPTKTNDYFSDTTSVKYAKARGKDTIILFEFIPEGNRFFANPSITSSAAVDLAAANRIIKTTTGIDPSVLGHSQGTVVIKKTNDLSIAYDLNIKWKEMYMQSPTAPITVENFKEWETQTTGFVRETDGTLKPAVFVIMPEGDLARATQNWHAPSASESGWMVPDSLNSPDSFENDYGSADFSNFKDYAGIRFTQPKVPNALGPVSIHMKINTDGNGWIDNTPPLSNENRQPGTPDNQEIINKNPITGLTLDAEKKFVKTGFPFICPNCDDDGGNLGGVNFSHVELTAISTNLTVTPSGQYGFFNYVVRAEKEKNGTAKIDVGNSSALAYNTFFVGLFMPNNLFWVNLNPWEPNRLIGDGLEKTDAGRVMLEADLQMKKDFAKYENPCESDVGARYWKKLDDKSDQLVQNLKKKYPHDFNEKDRITFSTVSRNWIVPDKIIAQGTGDTIYLESATLTIESEPVFEHSQYDVKDRISFLFSQPVKDDLAAAAKEYGKYSMELQDEMIRPLVVRDINTAKEYADLRTVYHSLILAQWYKNKFQTSPALFSDAFDSGKIESYGSDSHWKPESTWQAYKTSYEKHEYECVKTEKIYQAGGVKFDTLPLSITGPPSPKVQTIITETTVNYYASDDDNYYIGEPLFVYGTINEKETNSESGFIDSILQSLFGNLLEHRIYPGQYGSS